MQPDRVEYQNPDYMVLNFDTLVVQTSSDGVVKFDLNQVDVHVIVTAKPIPDGHLYTNNREMEVVYVKKKGRWYSNYNFGHERATTNPDTWSIEEQITDAWVRDNLYPLVPGDQ